MLVVEVGGSRAQGASAWIYTTPHEALSPSITLTLHRQLSTRIVTVHC